MERSGPRFENFCAHRVENCCCKKSFYYKFFSFVQTSFCPPFPKSNVQTFRYLESLGKSNEKKRRVFFDEFCLTSRFFVVVISLLLSASPKRCFVSLMQDFLVQVKKIKVMLFPKVLSWAEIIRNFYGPFFQPCLIFVQQFDISPV